MIQRAFLHTRVERHRPNFQPALAATFRPVSAYESDKKYALLPFRFMRLDAGRSVMTNVAGQHIVVADDVVRKLVERDMEWDASHLDDFESAHFVSRGSPGVHMELLAAQIRTRQARLPDLASLHIFVLTLRCNHTCAYCQVSRVSEDRIAFDMTAETADRAVDIMLEGPSRHIKVEFQGGESLLNFPLLQRIVRRTKEKAGDREVSFVVATNLTVITDEMLEFFREHRVFISTSLDGPQILHDRNRQKPGHDAYAKTIVGIKRCRETLGQDAVSALMTCSAESLDQPEAIIDEYVAQGFTEIFLREISPYGFAVKSASRIGYETERFIEFYKRGLAHILALNRQGVQFREVYSSILLQRMLTAFSTGYVDLQSPTGAGLATLVYNYDGDVYASDEGRMLAEMHDTTFRLGNVHRDNWKRLHLESPLLQMAYDSMTEGVPGCSDCAFQPWCGSDPVRHHASQGDIVGHKPTSAFCRRNMEIMRHLVTLLEDDPVSAKILRRWVR